MTMTIENSNVATQNDIAKRRYDYEAAKRDLKKEADEGKRWSILIGSLWGGASAIGASRGIEALSKHKFTFKSKKPVAKLADSLFESDATKFVIPVILGTGVAIGIYYAFQKAIKKASNNDLEKINKEYADILTQDEIKEHKLDVQQ